MAGTLGSNELSSQVVKWARRHCLIERRRRIKWQGKAGIAYDQICRMERGQGQSITAEEQMGACNRWQTHLEQPIGEKGRPRCKEERKGKGSAKGRQCLAGRRGGRRDARIPRAGRECHAILADAKARDPVLMAIEDADTLSLLKQGPVKQGV